MAGALSAARRREHYGARKLRDSPQSDYAGRRHHGLFMDKAPGRRQVPWGVVQSVDMGQARSLSPKDSGDCPA